ncbi:MAG: helix-turn-helix domain-containing protein [Ruminococcaceae bacterium]|nr:helix-turn-helix domain-containing protein [Oscillospiraceae bacterium]
MEFMGYREGKQHGSEGFPLELYRVDEGHPGYIMACHWHRECELICVHQGQLRIFLDTREYLLNPGDVCYVAQGVLHSAQPEGCVYDCVDFDPSALLAQTRPARHLLRRLENDDTMISPIVTSPVVRSCMDELLAAVREQPDGWQLIALSALFRFYGAVVQQKLYEPASATGSHRLTHLKSALAYIHQNYQQHITLDELSRISGLTPKYFCRYFRSMVHRTPMDYLNYCRVQNACVLLEQTQQSVTQIAYACGFNDSSYFTRCFKAQTGVTPLGWRKAHR